MRSSGHCSGDELYQFRRMTCNVVKNMRNLKKPIIAAVNCIAAGAGAMLMVGADLRIFADQAQAAFCSLKWAYPEPIWARSTCFRESLDWGKATELIYFGDTINAEEAHRIGLANRVVPGDALMDEAYRWAKRLKEGPLYALGVTKSSSSPKLMSIWKPALEMEATAQARSMQTKDFMEG